MLCEHPDCLAVGFHLHVVFVPKGRTLEDVWQEIHLFGCLDGVAPESYAERESAFAGAAAASARADDGDGVWAIVSVGDERARSQGA